MEWDSKTCAWNGAGGKLELQDNSYHPHLATLAGTSGSGITNMFSVDLKLGRLEDMRGMSMETALKNSLPMNMAAPSSASPVLALSKRGRPRNSGGQSTVFCSVDGCTSDLKQCREYHRRHKVCERHSKMPVVLVGGKEQRFCQQCSRFHSLEEFDEVKRSCRKRLDGHNRRRRKRQPETFYMPDSSGGYLSTHTGDGMLQFCCPQMHTVNWPTISQPDLYFRNNQETIYKPFQNGSAPAGSRRGGLKVSPDNSGCALSLLSRYSSQSSDTCVGPTVQPSTMSSSSTQGSITALHLNNSLTQFSCSQSFEDIENSASYSSSMNNHAQNFGGFHLGHDGFREHETPRNFPFGWE